ncbi:hypothetical protein VMCG_03224 [Cytospora schulzeri]|uniref:Large ribosomal subunit protein mL50 n=1 Tax=Cytospora schulzeri TaxID=448051 RepID=A0A423WXX5_9PEZI|nr:hypothetical protein VMCG_03224 [Valsa malicola]
MRRIARIQRPSAAITQCLQASSSASAPQHAVVCRAATTAAATSTIRSARDFSTTPQRTFHGSRTREDKSKVESATEAAPARDANQASSTEVVETQLAATEEQSPRVETDLALPPDEITLAPRADMVEEAEPDYTPAEHAEGLEVVGGLKGWFERDDHWGGSKRYAGFVPTHKVQDPSLLELSVKRAVVEALAVSAQQGNAELLTGLWERGEKEDAVRVLGLGVQVAEDGSAKLVGDVEGVVKALRWDPDAPGSSASLDEEVGRQRFTPEEAGEIVKTWDKTWKTISLRDVRLKFAVTKRILQLTGHTIPDSKLHAINTTGHLVSHLVKPPPATKVAEAIEQQGELTNLPNVRVHATRRTPVHKHQEVGRWKVIVEELEKRKMPALGDGGIGAFVEDKWFRGPRLPKNERKKRR